MVDSPGEADGALCAGGEAALQAGGGAVHRPGLSIDTVVPKQDTSYMAWPQLHSGIMPWLSDISQVSHRYSHT